MSEKLHLLTIHFNRPLIHFVSVLHL